MSSINQSTHQVELEIIMNGLLKEYECNLCVRSAEKAIDLLNGMIRRKHQRDQEYDEISRLNMNRNVRVEF